MLKIIKIIVTMMKVTYGKFGNSRNQIHMEVVLMSLPLTLQFVVGENPLIEHTKPMKHPSYQSLHSLGFHMYPFTCHLQRKDEKLGDFSLDLP